MSEELKCKNCGKIIVGKSQFGLCPMCVDNGKRKLVKGSIGLFAGVAILYKPVKEIIKGIADIVKKS